MSRQSVWQMSFDFLGSKPIVVEPLAGGLTSDAGLLPLRQFDEAFGLTRQFADALEDSRYQPFVDHSLVEMVRMRVYGILADYEDQNDHSVLRSDPVFKLVAGRSPDDDDLASQPTLSRFENGVSVRSLFRLRCVVPIRRNPIRRPNCRPPRWPPDSVANSIRTSVGGVILWAKDTPAPGGRG